MTAFGNTGQCIATLVTTPSVPSEPMKRCFKWYPVLSFLRVFRESMIVPSAFTLKFKGLELKFKKYGQTTFLFFLDQLPDKLVVFEQTRFLKVIDVILGYSHASYIPTALQMQNSRNAVGKSVRMRYFLCYYGFHDLCSPSYIFTSNNLIFYNHHLCFGGPQN